MTHYKIPDIVAQVHTVMDALNIKQFIKNM